MGRDGTGEDVLVSAVIDISRNNPDLSEQLCMIAA
jgi:hypothetical protein